MAGHAAEQLADGASWDLLLRQRVLDPLGMARSGTSIDAAIVDAKYKGVSSFEMI